MNVTFALSSKFSTSGVMRMPVDVFSIVTETDGATEDRGKKKLVTVKEVQY